MQRRDGERAVELCNGRVERTQHVTVEVLLHEVCDYLSVGLGHEGVPRRPEAVTELHVVLNDAVVDDRDLAGAVDVRVRVYLRGGAVRCPTSVADPGGATDGI